MATMTTPAPPKAQRDKTASGAPGPRDPRDTADRAPRAIPPRVDIYETEKIYVLLADMPGVLPDGLDVVAERDELVIRGRVERPARTPDYQEFELANYYRAFTLTDDLDTDGSLCVAMGVPGLHGDGVVVRLPPGAPPAGGERGAEAEDKSTHRHFILTVPLPPGLDLDRPEARLSRGVLTIRFPRTPTRP